MKTEQEVAKVGELKSLFNLKIFPFGRPDNHNNHTLILVEVENVRVPGCQGLLVQF